MLPLAHLFQWHRACSLEHRVQALMGLIWQSIGLPSLWLLQEAPLFGTHLHFDFLIPHLSELLYYYIIPLDILLLAKKDLYGARGRDFSSCTVQGGWLWGLLLLALPEWFLTPAMFRGMPSGPRFPVTEDISFHQSSCQGGEGCSCSTAQTNKGQYIRGSRHNTARQWD